MSQKTLQDQDLRRATTLPPNKEEAPIIGLSPDDHIGVTSDNTGKPPVAPPPPPPQPGS